MITGIVLLIVAVQIIDIVVNPFEEIYYLKCHLETTVKVRLASQASHLRGLYHIICSEIPLLNFGLVGIISRTRGRIDLYNSGTLEA